MSWRAASVSTAASALALHACSPAPVTNAPARSQERTVTAAPNAQPPRLDTRDHPPPPSQSPSAAPAAPGEPAPAIDWAAELDAVAAAKTTHVLQLTAEVRSSDLTDLLRLARAKGYSRFVLEHGRASVTITGRPRPIPAKGEVELLVSSRGWSLTWLSSNGDAVKVDGSSRLQNVTRRLRRLFRSSWAGAPCALTVGASADAPLAHVAKPVFAYFEARKCRRELAFGQLEDGQDGGVTRREGPIDRHSGRTLRARVATLALPPLPEAEIREERSVRVGGMLERWRIVWRTAPTAVCTPDDDFNCPCVSFRYAERGDADLVRSRPGEPDDLLPLAELFSRAGFDAPLADDAGAVLRRRPHEEGDYAMRGSIELWARVRARPIETVMDLRDYNGDGWATEFLLPIGSVGCAGRYAIVVGVSRRHPELHAFGSVANPEVPLALSGGWSRLLESRGATRYVDRACGFRGADTQTEVELRTDAQGVHATSFTYACDSRTGARARLLSRRSL